MKKPFVAIIICLILLVIGFTGCTNQNNPFKFFKISAPSTVTEGDSFNVIITSDGDPISNVSVSFNEISKLSDLNGKVTFSAPQVVTNWMGTITAKKGGLTVNTTIHILNFPALQIAEINNVSIGSQFVVTVTDDTGAYLSGLIVTMDGQTNTTIGGKVTFIAPMQPGNYTITAEFTGFRSATTTIKVE